MITPTHILFGATLGIMSGYTGTAEIAAVVVGSCLPDLDSPQAFIGRISGPIAPFLNKKFGHRKFIHSLVLWLPLIVLGWSFDLTYLVCLGAMSHLFLDLFNRSGVELFSPLTSKVFVCLGYRNRIQTASKAEYILIAIFVFMLFGALEMQRAGGPRLAFARLIGSYSLAYERYIAAGPRMCYMDCIIRQKSGSVYKRKYLIIGSIGVGQLALYDEAEKMVYTTKDFQILSAYLTISDKDWNSIRIETGSSLGLASYSGDALGFWYDEREKRWRIVERDKPVSGLVIYDEGAIKVKNENDSLFADI